MNNLNHQIKKSDIKFFKPKSNKGRTFGDCLYDIYITIGIKGKIRQSNRHELNLKNFSRKENTQYWKYVKVGIYQNDIYICSGESTDGYKISLPNYAVTNKDLVLTICDHYDLNIPKKPDEFFKIGFNVEKIPVLGGMNQIYKLIKL